MSRRLLASPVVVLLACSAAGASDTVTVLDSSTLDCARLSRPSCWREALEEAAYCAAPFDEMGTLDPPRRFCTFHDGQKILFEEPLPTPLPGQPATHWKLVIEKYATECMRYEQVTDGEVHVQRLTFPWGASYEYRRDASSATITCADGTTLGTPTPQVLDSCTEADNLVPGSHATGAADWVSFTLLGGGTSTTPLFSCGRRR